MRSTTSKIFDPRGPILCSTQSVLLVSFLTFSASSTRGQRDIPSAKVFYAGYVLGNVAPPALDFEATEHSHGKILPLALCPAALMNHVTAAMLSPRIAIGPPVDAGLSTVNSSISPRCHYHPKKL